MMRSCERTWEIDASREGRLSAHESASCERHRKVCDECRRRFNDDERLRVLGRALSAVTVSPLRTRELRQSILRAASAYDRDARSSRSRQIVVALGAAVTIGLSGAWAFKFPPFARPALTPRGSVFQAASAFGATIDAEPGAGWATATEGLTENVTLTSGAITLRVRHRVDGERFIVTLPDGQIEVRGTHFRVEVIDHETRSIEVIDGCVAFRRRSEAEIVLSANEHWRATASTAERVRHRDDPSSSSFEAAPLAPPRPQASFRRARRTTVADDGSEYESAVDLFVSRDYEGAAHRLHAFAVAHPDRSESEDAAFLEASSLAHVGRIDAAGVVAERFLDRYPASLHASDAAILAVRAARSRGDCSNAKVIASRAIAEAEQRAAALGACIDR